MAVIDEGTHQPADSKEKPKLELVPSRQFPEWLAGEGASLAFTTYQAGKVLLIGTKEVRRLSVFERTLNRCMGMAAAGNRPDPRTG